MTKTTKITLKNFHTLQPGNRLNRCFLSGGKNPLMEQVEFIGWGKSQFGTLEIIYKAPYSTSGTKKTSNFLPFDVGGTSYWWEMVEDDFDEMANKYDADAALAFEGPAAAIG